MAKYYFNLPDKLTIDQQNAIDDPESISVYGGPGTGKTVVNLWRHIRNHENGKNSLLLTYTKTLEHYLRGSANEKNPQAAKNISRTYKWIYNNRRQNYREIIIDEAQDVHVDRYNVIQQHAKTMSYGADPDQSVYLNIEETKKVLAHLDATFKTNRHTLYKNFRNSKDILLFTQSVFPEICIEQETIEQAESNTLPLVSIVGWDIDNCINKIVEIVNEYSSDTSNVGILLPTRKQVSKFFDLLKDKFECSKYASNNEEEDNDENEIFEEFKKHSYYHI